MSIDETRLAMRERPQERPVMYHRWQHLTFLHWPVPADTLQRRLPPGLSVDTFDGVAYVGLVPFTMNDIRLSWLPPVVGLRSSHETNVRTYVVDENGTPGVWFFSLDAENPVFVHVARTWYSLPYQHARMSVERAEDGARYASVRRFGPASECRVDVDTGRTIGPAAPGTLEFFLIERYVLFAWTQRGLYQGRVWHEPYVVREATARSMQEDLLKAVQITHPDTPPLVHFCDGVEVSVYPLVPTSTQNIDVLDQ